MSDANNPTPVSQHVGAALGGQRFDLQLRIILAKGVDDGSGKCKHCGKPLVPVVLDGKPRVAHETLLCDRPITCPDCGHVWTPTKRMDACPNCELRRATAAAREAAAASAPSVTEIKPVRRAGYNAGDSDDE